MNRIPARRFVAAAVFLLTFAYFVCLNERAPWVLDDYPQIVQNPTLHSMRSIPGFFTGRVQDSVRGESFAGDIYRPFFLLSLLSDYQLFGPNPRAFHIHNDILHALNVLLLFLLALRFVPIWGAVLASAVFAFHPIVIEAVTWISARTDLLAMLFALLHLHAAVRIADPGTTASLKPWWLLYGATIPLGLYSKETFAPIPILAPLALGLTAHADAGVRRRLLSCLGVSLALLIPALAWRGHIVHRDVPLLDPVIFKNCVTLSKRFIELLVLPGRSAFLRLYEHVTFVPSRDLVPFFAHACGWLLVVAASWRRRLPMMGAGLILGCLLPVALILDMSTWIGERFFYIPLAGISLLVSALVAALLSSSRVHVSAFTRRTVIAGLSLWVILLSVQTVARSGDWSTEARLYRSVLEQDPSNYWAYYQLSVDSHRRGDAESETRNLRDALNLRPDYLPALNNLAVYSIQRRDFSQARDLLERSLKAAPKRPKTAFNYGYYFESKGDFRQALAWYRKALEFDPGYEKAAEALRRLEKTSGSP
ncbi:MAG: glycosyltransferase family 39 protein [Pseudomonadota bacterium]